MQSLKDEIAKLEAQKAEIQDADAKQIEALQDRVRGYLLWHVPGAHHSLRTKIWCREPTKASAKPGRRSLLGTTRSEL